MTVGFDPGLRVRRVSGPNPAAANYYEDFTDRPSRWTIAVQSEREPGRPCPPPSGQSFRPNQTGGPIALRWLPAETGYTVNLKTDLVNVAHPCGPGYFTWAALMQQGDATFPPANRLIVDADVYAALYAPAGAARIILGAQAWIAGRGRVVEFDLAVGGQDAWPDGHPDPDVLAVREQPDLTFVHLRRPVPIGLGVTSRVSVDFGATFANLMARGLLPAAAWSETIVQAFYIGHEVKDRAIADLWVAGLSARETP